MAALTEGKRAGAFIVSEAPGSRSRSIGTIDTGNLAAGTVLGKITHGAATASAITGTGNATCSAVTVGGGAQVGAHKLIAIAATKLQLFAPDGAYLGLVTAGTAATLGGLTFTITAGGTAMAAGDFFTITVAAGTGKYVQYDQDGVNGTEVAAGILYDNVNAIADDVDAVIINLDAEVNGAEITWPDDIEAGEKTAAIAQLSALGIIVR